MLMIMNNLDPAVAQVSFNTHNPHATTLYIPVWFTLCCSRLQSETTVMITGLFPPPPPFQFPQELVTYGGNGQVFSNWAQVRPLIQIMNLLNNAEQGSPTRWAPGSPPPHPHPSLKDSSVLLGSLHKSHPTNDY